MKEKRYELKTIKEILDVVNSENIEGFLTDFSCWLGLMIGSKAIGAEEKYPGVFHWIDDGKNNVSINIEIKSETNPLEPSK